MTSISRSSAFISATDRIAAGADRAVAGDGRGDMVELVPEAERTAELGDFAGEVGEQARTSVLPSAAGTARTSIAVGPKRSISRPSSASSAERAFEPVAVGLVQLDDFGDQQRLPSDRAALPRGTHPFEHQPLVRGMLVDDDQAVLRLGDDIGRGDLPARDAERKARDRLDRRLGAGGWRVPNRRCSSAPASLPRTRGPTCLNDSGPRFRGDDE